MRNSAGFVLPDLFLRPSLSVCVCVYCKEAGHTAVSSLKAVRFLGSSVFRAGRSK